MKAIETRYAGYRFRSRLEARWAVLLDRLGVQWQYEKEGYNLGDGVLYLPDFWLPKFETWIEVKGGTCSDEDYDKVDRLRKESGKVVVVVGDIPTDEYEATHDWSGVFEPLKLSPERVAFGIQNAFGDDVPPEQLGALCGCPVCGVRQVQLTGSVSFNTSPTNIWSGNGCSVLIGFECKIGHLWDLRFGSDGKQTFAGLENVYRHCTDVTCWLADFDRARRDEAVIAAKSARFEHGETPSP